MSDVASQSEAAAVDVGHVDAHDHPDHLAHHFDSISQQIDSAKLGMWVFLSTELLMFGGLFCAYTIYRWNHPQVFLYAHKFLSTQLGALNTVILITSSMTMAWAVRASMLGQQKLLKLLLIITLLGGCGFLTVKYFEYSAKFASGLYPGAHNAYYPVDEANERLGLAGDSAITSEGKKFHIYNLENYYLGSYGVHHYVPPNYREHEYGYHETHHSSGSEEGVENETSLPNVEEATPGVTQQQGTVAGVMPPVEQSDFRIVEHGPAGMREEVLERGADKTTLAAGQGHDVLTYGDLPLAEQGRVHIFYQIYYLMTGLHVLHVVIGMGLIGWVLYKATRGTFSAKYYTPVDIVGLYWHLVDLIWIFLFPLLYLIH